LLNHKASKSEETSSGKPQSGRLEAKSDGFWNGWMLTACKVLPAE
jgi:hypothetical protein